MYPWRRILIPTDFSTASEWVFEDAVRLAGASGAEIIILHIRMTRTSQPDQLRFPADPKLYEYAEQVELDKLRDRVRRANATVPTRLKVEQAPHPGEEIARVAREENCDLVVMATHARHHVAHLFIGSTTMAVVINPPCAVLAIRYGIRKHRAIRRMLVPVHMDQTSHAALQLAGAMAAREKGEVHVMMVCDSDDKERGESYVREVMSQNLPGGIAASSAVVTGDDVEREVIRYTEKSDADAVFLNATDAPSPLKLDIVRHAPVPVMIVPGTMNDER